MNSTYYRTPDSQKSASSLSLTDIYITGIITISRAYPVPIFLACTVGTAPGEFLTSSYLHTHKIKKAVLTLQVISDTTLVAISCFPKNSSRMSSQNKVGLAFNFKLPSEGLALRSVVIENGTPKLIFDAALKTPTLTEEDVGIACRLACEEVRPEFIYYAIPFHHPYHGRQYKHYSPQWLKGTSIGELLSEADWTMKCLNIGARSDKAKERFWAWQETSKLEGLADTLDFPCDQLCGSVMMTCDSVEVEKTETEMVFIGEPKMKITNDSSSSYTKYITKIYPNIAFYDEPLLLKVQELIKLVLAMEWLKEKGVRFSRPWMMKCSTPRSQKALQSIEVKTKGPAEDAIKEVIDNLVKQLPDSSHQEFMTVLGPLSVDTVVDKNITKTGIEVKIIRTILPSSLTSPKVEVTTTFRGSVNDYDMLYKGMDPNTPIRPQIPGISDAVVPNVQSWSELFAETVPWPRTWKMPFDGVEIQSATGGVSTSSIPVKETVTTCSGIRVPTREAVKESVPVKELKREGQYVKYSNGQLGVEAQGGKIKEATQVRSNMVPQPHKVFRPSSDVTSKTEQTLRNQALKRQGHKQAYGWHDHAGGQRVVYNENGQLIKEERGVRSCVEQRTRVNGKPEGLRPPPTLQPLPLGEEAALPAAVTGLFSPDSSIASKDSGFTSLTDGERSDMLEERRGEPDKDGDASDGSNDSGNNSPDDMDMD